MAPDDEDTKVMTAEEILEAIWNQPTRSPPCPACAARALALDSNDEVPDDSYECALCNGLGAVTADQRRDFAELHERSERDTLPDE